MVRWARRVNSAPASSPPRPGFSFWTRARRTRTRRWRARRETSRGGALRAPAVHGGGAHVRQSRQRNGPTVRTSAPQPRALAGDRAGRRSGAVPRRPVGRRHKGSPATQGAGEDLHLRGAGAAGRETSGGPRFPGRGDVRAVRDDEPNEAGARSPFELFRAEASAACAHPHGGPAAPSRASTDEFGAAGARRRTRPGGRAVAMLSDGAASAPDEDRPRARAGGPRGVAALLLPHASQKPKKKGAGEDLERICGGGRARRPRALRPWAGRDREMVVRELERVPGEAPVASRRAHGR